MQVTPKTGLKGLPNLAESVLVNRDLALADYNETKIHFSHISTAESVKLIKEAKKKGISVTADVSIMHLLFNDEDILEFDSNFKCNPPLRSKKDQEALIKGLKDGVIDAICTDHNAQDTESKKVEFDNALFGTSTAQWTFSKAYEKLVKGLGQERVIELFTSRPCEILGKENNIIKEGETVNFTLFSPKEEWEFNATSNQSKSLNSPFLQSKIRGKIIATGRNKDIYRF